MAFDDFYAEPEPAPAVAEPAAQPQYAREPDPAPWSPPIAHRSPMHPLPSPTAQRAKAGLGLVAAAAGAAAGAAFGGPLGMVAGLAGVGALRNLYRAQGLGSSDPTEQGDAAKSLAIALVGAAIAGYLGYKAFSRKSQ